MIDDNLVGTGRICQTLERLLEELRSVNSGLTMIHYELRKEAELNERRWRDLKYNVDKIVSDR